MDRAWCLLELLFGSAMPIKTTQFELYKYSNSYHHHDQQQQQQHCGDNRSTSTAVLEPLQPIQWTTAPPKMSITTSDYAMNDDDDPNQENDEMYMGRTDRHYVRTARRTATANIAASNVTANDEDGIISSDTQSVATCIDPVNGGVTNENDRNYIQSLTWFAKDLYHWW